MERDKPLDHLLDDGFGPVDQHLHGVVLGSSRRDREEWILPIFGRRMCADSQAGSQSRDSGSSPTHSPLRIGGIGLSRGLRARREARRGESRAAEAVADADDSPKSLAVAWTVVAALARTAGPGLWPSGRDRGFAPGPRDDDRGRQAARPRQVPRRVDRGGEARRSGPQAPDPIRARRAGSRGDPVPGRPPDRSLDRRPRPIGAVLAGRSGVRRLW